MVVFPHFGAAEHLGRFACVSMLLATGCRNWEHLSRQYGADMVLTDLSVVDMDASSDFGSDLARDCPGNLVPNPGFEEADSGIAGWTATGTPNPATLTRILGGHGGSSALRVCADPYDQLEMTLWVDYLGIVAGAAAGTNYHLSAWTRSSGMDNFNEALQLYLKVDGQFTAGSAGSLPREWTLWPSLPVSVAPPNATLDLEFHLQLSSQASQVCFDIDDVCLQLVP